MLSPLAREIIDVTTSTSFACDLRKWLQIMEAYENGGFAYHATMPTDGLVTLRDVMKETEAYGFDKVRAEQLELGKRVRSLLADKGFKSVAAEGFEAPGVVVSYTDDDGIRSGKKFADAGLQIAPAFPFNAMSLKISRPSASDYSAWTNCKTSKVQWPGSRRRWTVFFRAFFVLRRMCVLLVLATASAGGTRNLPDSYAHYSALAAVRHTSQLNFFERPFFRKASKSR